MSDTSYAAMLLRLSKQYYQGHIGFEKYRIQRKTILDKIDEEFNGCKQHDLQAEDSEPLSPSMNTMEFFKGRDVEN